MKSLRALKAAGLVLAAVVLGLMTVQGSYALWNATASANAGTIQAANFSILVNGTEMASLQQPVPLQLPELKPGTSTFTQVTVKNNVNATSAMRVRPTVSLGQVPQELSGYLTIQAVKLEPGKTCLTSAATDLGTIGKGETATICLRAELRPNTPALVLGNTVSIQANLTVSQMPA